MKTLRPLAGSLIAPIIGLLARTPLTPNGLTILGTLLTVGVAVVVAIGDPRLGGVLALVVGAFDMLDGGLARATGKTSRFGAFLDSTLDRVSEIALLFGISARYAFAGDGTAQLLVLAALGGSLMVSYTRARAEATGAQAEVGLLDRPARLIVLAAGLILDLVIPALVIVAVLTAITTAQRILVVRKQLEDR